MDHRKSPRSLQKPVLVSFLCRTIFVNELRTKAFLFLIVLGLGCARNAELPARVAEQKTTATINLSAITGTSDIELFHEVTRAGMLPGSVLAELGGIADPGGPFNSTDAMDRRLPRRQMVAAAVSERHCIVSYIQGGFTVTFKTSIFELSRDKARTIWISTSQGGLNFLDLKKMVESGRMRNDLAKRSTGD
jgi:hypothetical protein